MLASLVLLSSNRSDNSLKIFSLERFNSCTFVLLSIVRLSRHSTRKLYSLRHADEIRFYYISTHRLFSIAKVNLRSAFFITISRRKYFPFAKFFALFDNQITFSFSRFQLKHSFFGANFQCFWLLLHKLTEKQCKRHLTYRAMHMWYFFFASLLILLNIQFLVSQLMAASPRETER